MNNFKVWKMNDCEWWAGEDFDNTVKTACEEMSITKDDFLDEPVEGSLDEKMWYGFDFEDLNKYLKDKKPKSFEIKKDERGDFCFVLHLTYKEVLEIEKPTAPFCIASTEF